MSDLIPLRVNSEYSLLSSCIKSKEAALFCKKNNIDSIAITDKHNMFGVMQWSLAMIDQQIKPIIGAELSVSDGYVTVLCKNPEGYKELSNILSFSFFRQNEKLIIADLASLKNCFLLLDYSLTRDEIIFVSKMEDVESALAVSRQVKDLYFETSLFEISNALQMAIVAAPKFNYIYETEILALDTLLCIKNGSYLAEIDREKAQDDAYLAKISEFAKKFDDIPFAIENCNIVAKKCNFVLKKQSPKMPKLGILLPEQELRKLVINRLNDKLQNFVFKSFSLERQDEIVRNYFQRAAYELEMIEKMGFCDYFLIITDIVNWAKKNNIMVGPGRGSGASCLVAWALGITNIDPIKFNLMFERFLNPDRVSLPDFDIDFCQEKRDLVINYIQKRFGEENVAHIITFGSLQYRAAIRDVGRVMQIPYPIVDALCKKLPAPFQGVAPTIKDLRIEGKLKDVLNAETEELFFIAEKIEGAPRHSSVHPAGVVIGNQKLADLVPLFKEKDVKMPIIQFSMKPAEQIGLVKFDILGLTILSTLKKTIELIQQTLGVILDLDTILETDKETFEMLQKGLVKGVFQVDTPGFKNLMIQMQPTCINDLVAAGALYRPGPMQDIPQFIKCKKEGIGQYLYKEMEPILEETYSVIVYQEQVLQIAKELAGYSLKEADLLRRAVGKKIKSEMALHEEKFINGVVKKCNTDLNVEKAREKAKMLFDNLARFASYGFPKAHAAPYALMTYQSAYLKKHFSEQFFCATLCYEHNQEKMEEIIQEAKKMNVKIQGPSVNHSDFNFSLKNNCIIFGLSKIKGVGESANIVILEREKNGLFKSIEDFMHRFNLNKKVLENFVYSGAFDCISNVSRAKQFEDISEKKKELTMNLFELEEIIDDNEAKEIEIIKNEYMVLGTIFYTKSFEFDLVKFGIVSALDEIEYRAFVFAIGIGSESRKNKDDNLVITYKFIDKSGVQELFCNVEYKIFWKKIIMEMDKVQSDGDKQARYYIKHIYELSDFFAKYKKIFIESGEKAELLTKQLKFGETSIYSVFDNQTNLIGNYTVTLEYMQIMQHEIISII